MPDRLQAMLSTYARFEKDNKVMPLPLGYSQTRQLILNMLRDRLRPTVLVALLTILLLIPFVDYPRTRR